MGSRLSCLRLILLLVCTLLLGGCSSPPIVKPQPQVAKLQQLDDDLRRMREIEMNYIWIGQPYEELIQEFGQPRMIMNVPAYRPWNVSVVVYGRIDPASDCIDAFTVVHNGKPVIDGYFCR